MLATRGVSGCSKERTQPLAIEWPHQAAYACPVVQTHGVCGHGPRRTGDFCVRLRLRRPDLRGLPIGYQPLLGWIPVMAGRGHLSLRVGRKPRRARDHEAINNPLPDGEQAEIGRCLANLDQP